MRKKAAVIGMGYVGIPSALLFAESESYSYVYGIQRVSKRSGSKISDLNSGINPFKEEKDVGDLLNVVLRRGKFECTSDYSVIEECDLVTVTVQTPTGLNIPDYSHLESAVDEIGKNLKDGCLVSIESTITPGTTEGWVKEVLEGKSGKKCGEDFYLVHAPERVKPGRLLKNIRELDRCIGGVDSESTVKGVECYIPIMKGGEIHMMTATEAEVVKTAENAIRDVQIAIANQLAVYCETFGINYWNVHKGISSLHGEGVSRCLLHPGSGVGGHCLVKDTLHLEKGHKDFSGNKTSGEFRGGDYIQSKSLFLSSRQINDYMPYHMVELTEYGLSVRKKVYRTDNKNLKFAILGWAFAENTSDDRNTPSKTYYDGIKQRFDGDVMIHDPYVEISSYDICRDLNMVLSGADVVAIMTGHKDYSILSGVYVGGLCNPHAVIVDGRNVIDPEQFMNAGFVYMGIGRGDILKMMSDE